MIVKITYSADVKDIPNEVSKLLDSTSTNLSEVLDDIKSLVKELKRSEVDVVSSISKIEHDINLLETIDMKLKDSHSILSGYLDLISKQEQQGSEVEAENKHRSTKKKAG